ncbi:MAG: toxin [Bacteroidales bacterium]|nr:toxin [Bacteroidales bacterium]MDD4218038.1 toxin [Bacteroidales bacterium]MDY0141797.1 toxin [Bacteroidales bacterium]
MATRNEVEKYLTDLKQKIKFFGILIWDDRSKNRQALLDLEISPSQRKDEILKLQPENYMQGPIDEKMHGILPMWVFGTMIKGKEVYIKVSMGVENSQAVCISFHVAEFEMSYPLKTK